MIYPNYLVTGKHQTGRRFSMIFRKDRLIGCRKKLKMTRDVMRRNMKLMPLLRPKNAGRTPFRLSKRGFHLQIFCKYKRPIKVTDDAEIDTDIRLYPAYWEYSARN